MTRAVDGSDSDATLSSFTVVDDLGRQVLLYTSFDPETGLYDASVGNDVASVTATAVPAQAGATLFFFDGDATGTPGQVTRDLEVGFDRVKVVVTATDGVTSKIYIILVRRAAADAATDATLGALTLEDDQGVAVGLAPATFDPETTDYTAEVANDVGSVAVEATTTDPNAVVLIFGEDGAHDMDSRSLNLNVGDNSIKVIVSAEDATTAKIYNLTVTRAASENADDATLSGFDLENHRGAAVPLTPVFDPATTVYTASVSNHVASVTLTATKNHPGATVSVIAQDGGVTADTGTVDLAVGENLIKAMVIAEDGDATMIYMVTVTRAASTDATLDSLTLLDDQGAEILIGPTLDPGTGQYGARVANTVQSVAARAVMNHDGATIVFVGAASAGIAGEATQGLDVGDNLVKAMVTAEDGVTVRIYMVSVTRAAADSSDDASLSELVVADGSVLVELTPAFDPEVSNYVASVRSSLDQGDLEFRGSESSVPVMRTRGAYWWALEDPGWAKDDQVAVGITVPEDPQSMSERPLASPVARFSQLPASHDGATAIVFRISFSDTFEMDFRTLRDEALEATNGEVRRAKRVNKDSNLKWEIRVKPDGTDDVVITLPATEDCADAGALCTSDGRMLYDTVSVTIPGP